MTDTQSTEAIIHALYDTISGPAGEERDWDRFRALFLPDARLMRTSMAADGSPHVSVMDVEVYVEDTTAYFRQESFYEREIAHRVDAFGNIAHVWSVYEACRQPDDAEPFKRGINSVQLFYDGRRWWVANVLWDNEREDNPIPAEYLL